MELFSQRTDLKQRDPKFKKADQSALQAIAQAAINVELFTIPLYMVSLYSIQGMHQITSKGNDFYQGRLWPGRAPSPDPDKDPNPANARAFNVFFSIFIDEMLHLQLAANIAKVLGVTPSFTSPALMSKDYGWTCYGPNRTQIPHILDFTDTVPPYNKIRVKLDALTKEQNGLFLAIEENDKDAEGLIAAGKKGKYFPPVPFANWNESSTEADLPMFGSIGYMYKCLWQYMEIEYTDRTTLFASVFAPEALERDLFNAASDYHKPEYPKMATTASDGIPADATTDQRMAEARGRILRMINAITDQGEGQGVAQWISERLGLLQYAPVEEQFRPDEDALNFDYPNYTDTGKLQNPSGNTVARSKSGGLDHYDRFVKIGEELKTGNVVTWDQWHSSSKTWEADMLQIPGYKPNEHQHSLPPPITVAFALNELRAPNNPSLNYYPTFSQIASGAIAGITRVLADFWTKKDTAFPSPSMYGSGDRVSICWAIFGKYPDLSKGIAAREPGTLYHACQALDITRPGDFGCAPIAVAHSCRGSNTCKAEGGCGFVQLIGSFFNCSQKALLEHLQTAQPAPGDSIYYSAPSDNTCAGAGGCAIPISASQMFPPPDSTNPKEGGTMALYDVVAEDPGVFDEMKYNVGDLVYDVAWKAYIKVLENRGVAVPPKPGVSMLRVALPPST